MSEDKEPQLIDTCDYLKEQGAEAEKEKEKFDHDELDDEFGAEMKERRKRHRKNVGTDLLDNESDVDEEFKLDFNAAALKFGYKRKKKHQFNEDGVPMEPFNINSEVRSGLLSKEGYI